MNNPSRGPRIVLGTNAYTRFGSVEKPSGANVYQSPQAPPPLARSIPQVPGPLPNIGARLTLSGSAYGR